MKRQVRRGCFESNSSSQHSIVVKKEDLYYKDEAEARKDIYVSSKGIVSPLSDELSFGRYPFKVLTGIEEKAYYVLASMCAYKGDKVYNEVCEIIRSLIPGFVDFKLSFRIDHYNADNVTEEDMKLWFGEGNYLLKDERWIGFGYELGYVDEDILSSFLKKRGIDIKEFLTNKRYIVIVDGDEYCIYEDMKENGLIDTSVIEEEYPGEG